MKLKQKHISRGTDFTYAMQTLLTCSLNTFHSCLTSGAGIEALDFDSAF